jgi:hypothetical protein
MIAQPSLATSSQEQIPSRDSSAPRLALWIVLWSFVACAAWEIFRTNAHPFGDLSNGQWTDHFSHMNCARLFPRAGLDLWRKPVSSMFRELTRQEQGQLPQDVRVGASATGGIYSVPGWPFEKPLAVNWSHNPRIYPPGDLLLFSPVALLYHYTSLSAAGANRLAILLCVLLAHAAIYIFIRLYLDRKDETAPVALIGVLVFYAFALFWSLQGFYDCAAVPPLLLCGRFLGKKRGIDAVLAYCVAAAIHFRVFFLAPLPLYGAWMILRYRQWQTWHWNEWMKAGAAALLAAVSLSLFFVVWRSVSHLPIDNIVNIWQHPVHYSVLCVLGAVWLFAALGFACIRAWFDLAILLSLAVILPNACQAYQWHVLIPLAWLSLPIIPEGAGARRTVVVQDIRLAILLVMAFGIFKNHFLPL